MRLTGFYFYDGTTYRKLRAILVSLVQHTQTPINADDMVIRIDADTPSPPFGEIVYVVDGTHIFHGLITKIGDYGNYKTLTCRSMQFLLDYRVVPYNVYHDVDLDTILASDIPSTVMGMWFLINSYIPNGKWTYYNATVRKLVDGGLKSCFSNYPLYASTSYPNAGTVDDCDGVVQLTDAGAVPTADDTYYRTTDDLYIRFGDGSYRENAAIVAALDWCDTRIRFGSIDIGTYKSAADFTLDGQASTIIDDFLKKLGRECEFLPKANGTIEHIIAAEVPGRSSEKSPLRNYVHGKNATIEFSNQTIPDVQAAISYGSDISEAPQVVTDWSWRGIQLLKPYSSQGAAKEVVLAELQGIIDNNELSCTVKTNAIDWYIRPGDWVSVYRGDKGYFALRVKEKSIKPGLMTLTLGKKISTASEIFGSYLRAEVDDDEQPRSETILLSGNTFSVSEENYNLGGLKVYYEESLSKTEDTDIDPAACLVLEINDVVVPPGRILLSKASDLKIDITDYCTMPGTNTAVGTLYNGTGWERGSIYIRQYLAVQFFAP